MSVPWMSNRAQVYLLEMSVPWMSNRAQVYLLEMSVLGLETY